MTAEEYKSLYEEALSDLDWYKDECDRLESELEDAESEADSYKEQYENLCDQLRLDTGEQAKLASVSDERRLEVLKSILRQQHSPILTLIEELETFNIFK